MTAVYIAPFHTAPAQAFQTLATGLQSVDFSGQGIVMLMAASIRRAATVQLEPLVLQLSAQGAQRVVDQCVFPCRHQGAAGIQCLLPAA